MICRQCRHYLLLRRAVAPPVSRAVASSRSTDAVVASQVRFQSFRSRLYSSAATGSSEFSPSSEAGEPAVTETTKVVSSIVGGTPLHGLNYEKNKKDPIALEDHEYPSWLWTLLDTSSGNVKGNNDVDVSKMNKKARKKHEKKMAAIAAAQPVTIPIHEQATDITPASYNLTNAETGPEKEFDTSLAGIAARSDVTKSARAARKKGIKEANFLRGL